ncbi:PREDICTED: uncharacterized protein LOC107073634, partial [Polistes dominula]|uniref:Uncharacterized protein LOC107073634 n=1 Tax=Polistes dominula TaxID=743375 RepID=A0ABM1JBH6_POLDO
DIKIYKKIEGPRDCVLLQEDLIFFYNWCFLNSLTLNVDKCHIVSFSRLLNPMQFNYLLKSVVLSRLDQCKDLGVIIDCKLCFQGHFDYITTRAYKMLGFIGRATVDFKDLNTLIYLYKSLVLSILCYASVIWSLHSDKYIYQLEKIQHRFLRLLCLRSKRPLDPFEHNYSQSAFSFGLPTLESSRIVADILFGFAVLCGEIDCNYLRGRIVGRALPYTIRNSRLLIELTHGTNLAYFSPIPRIIRLFNSLPESVNNVTSKHQLKMLLRGYFNKY